MLTIYLCLGSSCYVRGSDRVASALQEAIAQHGLQDQVDIVGTFCLEHCSMGVTLKMDDQVFKEVYPESVGSFFEEQILPRVEGMRTAL
jgi:NADH:ubiquinone oxidoreductase subunit E